MCQYGVFVFALLSCYGSLDFILGMDATIAFHHLIGLCLITSHLRWRHTILGSLAIEKHGLLDQL